MISVLTNVRKSVEKFRLQSKFQTLFILLYKIPSIKKLIQYFCKSSPDPNEWIFVVGCYNSGTSVLKTIVSLSPEVSCAPREGSLYTDELPTPEQLGWNRMWVKCQLHVTFAEELDQSRANIIKNDWRPFYQPGKVYLEKSISNLPKTRWLNANFHNARFIAIIRNPYAVIEGLQRKAFPRPPIIAKYPDGYPLMYAVEQWLVSAQMIVQLQKQLGPNFMTVRYEDLVSDPYLKCKNIYRFLNLSPQIIKRTTNNKSILFDGKNLLLKNRNGASFKKLTEADYVIINRILSENQQILDYFRYEIID